MDNDLDSTEFWQTDVVFRYTDTVIGIDDGIRPFGPALLLELWIAASFFEEVLNAVSRCRMNC